MDSDINHDLFVVDRAAILKAVEMVLELRAHPGSPVPSQPPPHGPPDSLMGLPDQMPDAGVGAAEALAAAAQIGIGDAVRLDRALPTKGVSSGAVR